MPQKDVYYFPHDSNAKRDPKLMMLRYQLGPSGYGIYWMLIEDLREQENYSLPLMILPALAQEYNISLEILKTIIEKFGLFQISENDFFYSPSLVRRMENWTAKKQENREKAKKAAEARWQKSLGKGNETPKSPKESVGSAQAKQRKSTDNTKEVQDECPGNAQALHEQCTGNADTMQPDAIREEKKREEKIKKEKIKEDNTHIKARVFEILEYFNFSEMNNPDKLHEAHQFVSVLAHRGRLDYFRKQFEAYKRYKTQNNEKRHTFARFLGDPRTHYENGGWNARNWAEELIDTGPSDVLSKIDDVMSRI